MKPVGHPRRRAIEGGVQPARQREKRPGGGALGQRLGNCGGSGGDGADCPSVPSGLAASVESGIGGFFGGSTTTVCGRRSLRADLTCAAWTAWTILSSAAMPSGRCLPSSFEIEVD